MSRPLHYVCRQFLLIGCFAIAYFVAGKLGLLLAIPPGYATVVWPASGVAVAGVLLYGNALGLAAFLGSFAVNVATSFDGTSWASTTQTLLLATSIAAGSSLQSIFSAALVRRYIGFPGPFGTLRGVLVSLALAGPIGCLLSASVGVTSLCLFGLLPVTQIPANLLTWWGGDAIGVLIVMPFLQVATSTQSKGRWSRVAWVGVPMSLFVVGTVVAHLQLKAYDENRIQARFLRKSAAINSALQTRIHGVLETLYATNAAMDAAHGKLSREQFTAVVNRFVDQQDVISNLSLNLRVKADEREAYERAVRDDGFPNFTITESLQDGTIAPARSRPDYCVVHYLEPMRAENMRVHGYDTALEPVRGSALLRARDSGRVTATGPIKLLQNYAGEMGVIVFLPLYRGSQPGDVESRRRDWIGALVAVVRVPRLISDAIRGFEATHFNIQLTDADADAGNILYSAGRFPESQLQSHFPGYTGKVQIGGRTWNLLSSPTPEYWKEHGSLEAWNVLTGGLLFTSFFGVFLLVLTGRTAIVEELVASQVTEIIEARARAEAASKAKGEFLANMSHEIRTPLNIILGATELVLEGRLDSKHRELLSTAYSSGGHLLTVINDVLDFSKIEAGKLSLDCREFCLRTCLSTTLQMFEVPAEQKGVQLKLTIDENVPTVIRADEGRLRQILLNLIGNAMKFTSSGEIEISVEAESAGPSSVRLLIQVRDTGVGIDQQQLDSIFAPFEQGDGSTTRKFGGTGLGLSIARRLVAMMGGTLSVTSRPERGSTFYFDIQAQVATTPPKREPQSTSSPSADLPQGLRVLVVDDSAQNVMLVKAMLERRGAKVMTCHDGQAAIDLLDQYEFDIVLMDMQMPRMGGTEATVAIRLREQKCARNRTPIIALTANALESDRIACLSAGMDGYLAKPISQATLVAEIRRVQGATDSAPLRKLSPDELLRRVDNQIELLDALVAEYSKESPRLCHQLLVAHRNSDVASLRKAVHTLRGATVMFGDSALKETLQKIESAARENPEAAVGHLVARVPEELEGFVSNLKTTLSDLRHRTVSSNGRDKLQV